MCLQTATYSPYLKLSSNRSSITFKLNKWLFSFVNRSSKGNALKSAIFISIHYFHLLLLKYNQSLLNSLVGYVSPSLAAVIRIGLRRVTIQQGGWCYSHLHAPFLNVINGCAYPSFLNIYSFSCRHIWFT